MKRLLQFIWDAIKVFHIVAASIVLVIIFVVLANAFSPKPSVSVPEGGALVLAPEGTLVEKKPPPDPTALFYGAQQPNEVLLRDLVTAIERAKNDESIAMLVLELDRLQSAGVAAMHSLGNAIAEFRESGKPVIAASQSYSQKQYYLAAQANTVWMNEAGEVSLAGYGVYPPHFAEGLEKLKAEVSVFRVGTYKSAVEPFIRNNMSEAAKQANRGYLNRLWRGYTEDVEAARELESGAIDQLIENIVPRLQAADGDLAELASASGLVDALKTEPEMREALIERVGKGDNGSYKRIGYKRYLEATASEPDPDRSEIAVVTLRGPIVPGNAPADQIGADNAVALIDRARRDDDVEAIVLRVDSGGGSSFASERIREALMDAKAAGKPVVASFGSVAASGGYWISATADEIVAMPETITGSIGIFGLWLGLEDSLDAIGVHTDGVGTTKLAGAFDPTRELPQVAENILQASIEHGYDEFLALVAEGRDMSVKQVDRIGQGRVWSGARAKQLGLVDRLGGLDTAVDRAAGLAELEDDAYRVEHVEEPLSPVQKILVSLREQAYALGLEPESIAPPAPVFQDMAQRTRRALERLSWMRDPKGSYALCMHCNVR